MVGLMNEYANKKVLVTGGTGFIGSRLVERLTLEEKADVTVMVHDWRKATWVSRTNAKLVRGEITNSKDVDRIVKGHEIVFHCVGVGGDHTHCKKVNVGGTKNVLDSCKKYNVERIVYLSTVNVYGSLLAEGHDEKAPFRKLGFPYPDSKIEAEDLFWEFIERHNINGTVITPTYVWGPRSQWFTAQPVKDLIKDSFYLVDEGSGACNAVYVDNLVDIILIAGYHPKAVGESFLLTDGEKITWREFFGHYAKMVNEDIKDTPSVKSFPQGKEKLIPFVKLKIRWCIGFLTNVIDRSKNQQSILIKYGLKVSRKILQLNIIFLNHVYHEPYDRWDLMKFSSSGFISIKKAEKYLNCTPRKTVEEGMTDCAIWLNGQNIIKNNL